jgi:uncharacterized protein (DUF488 family)
MSHTGRLLSVGYSNHTLEQFLALLRAAGVSALADVRTSPFSRYNPLTNGPQLSAALRAVGIAYVFLGEQLGGRPGPRELYDEDRVDYERVRQTAFFREGLERLIRGSETHVVAMMCGEEDPLDCHRGIMITPALVEKGIFPGHLRRDGRIETTPEMEQRLLALTKVGDGVVDGLFAAQLDEEDQRKLLAEAYRRRAKKIAFKLEETEEDH